MGISSKDEHVLLHTSEGNRVRIIDTDNFGGDYPDEKFWFWPMSKEKAQAICDAINAASGPYGSRY